jgi:hypothetical protein
MQGTVPGGRGRLGQLPWRDYVYRGVGYDTLTESPGERALRLSGKQQWARVRQPEPPPEPVIATSVGASGLGSKPEAGSVGSSHAKSDRCEDCGYLLTSKSHEVVCG